MEAFSRKSINVGAYVNTYDVSTVVVGGRLVVCERSMYGYGHAWAHNSIGYPMGLRGPAVDDVGVRVFRLSRLSPRRTATATGRGPAPLPALNLTPTKFGV